MYYLYILYSESIDKYYVGETPDIDVRLSQHNHHHFKTNFTKAASDWKIVLKFECKNREEALFLEKFIKKMKSRVFVQKVISNQEILSDLLKKM